MSIRIKRFTQDVYTGSLLTKSYTNHQLIIENLLCNQTHTKKWCYWTPSEHTPLLKNQTVSKNTFWNYTTLKHGEIQCSNKKGIKYTWVNQSLKFISTKSNSIPHTWDDPKAFEILKIVFD